MIFTLREIEQWLGITPFEILVQLVGLLTFTILLPLKLEGLALTNSSWWTVFSPLFVADGFNAYFVTIVLIRMYIAVSVQILSD